MLASSIAPTRVCDRTYTRVKRGSHASEVLVTRVSHATVITLPRLHTRTSKQDNKGVPTRASRKSYALLAGRVVPVPGL